MDTPTLQACYLPQNFEDLIQTKKELLKKKQEIQESLKNLDQLENTVSDLKVKLEIDGEALRLREDRLREVRSGLE